METIEQERIREIYRGLLEVGEIMTNAEKYLYNAIFFDGKHMLSPEINSVDFHAMTHEDAEILGMFCDFSGIHGEKLKEILIKGYMSSACRNEEDRIEWLDGNKDEKLQDTMIRTARNAHFSENIVKEEFKNKGVLGIYNLGMKHMYDYLKNKTE